MLGGFIQLAAWNMRRVWHEEPPSARQAWLEKKLVTPVIGVNFLRGWLKRKLDRNPVGWLEQRSWSGRIVTWGWFSVMISFYSVAFRGDNIFRIVAAIQQLMPVGMLMVMSGVACGSFQRERETRVLELLLVSPMQAEEIILGRLRGLWGQFLPCLALMLFVEASFQFVILDDLGHGIIFYTISYFTLPVIGLYYSLRNANFIAAFLATLMVGLVFPAYLPPTVEALSHLVPYLIGFGDFPGLQILARFMFDLANLVLGWDYSPALIQGLITYYLGRKLYRNLVRRNFAFVKTAS
jgi:hypothetical protein